MKLHYEIIELRKREKKISAEILEKLQLMEENRSYLGLGFSSLFDYLTRGLGYSPSRAYERQSCIRLTKEIPEIKTKVEEGKLSYSTLSTAFKTLRKKPKEEKRKVLANLENKSVRDVKKILSEPMKPVRIKKTEYQEKVVLRIEVSHEFNKKLDRLKALRSHQGNIEIILEKLIERELKKYEPTNARKRDKGKMINSDGAENLEPGKSKGRLNKSTNPRYISRRLENHLLKKANYRCQFPGCEENHYLQVDHIVPVRAGGTAEPENLQILCSAHNRWKG